MKLIIKLHSNWAIGSGKAGGSKDSIILKDDNDLPFIPGKTLKGLLRDAFLECGYSEKDSIRLFGQEKNDHITTEKLQDEQLRFNSAYLPETFTELDKNIKNLLYTTKTSTRLDEEKQAVEHSLRKNEVVIPVTLETNILYKKDNSELSVDDFEKIENATKMLKLLGEDRHRGLGRTKITVSKSDKSSSNENIFIKNDKKEIHFKCTVTEAMILVKKDKTGQNTDSLDYIPGNTFRGIVAGAINNGDSEEFDDVIFNGRVQFGDAHLTINDKRSCKVPLSFYKDKNSEINKIYNFHELEDKDWTDKKLKQIRNGYLIEENGRYKIKNIAYAERMKSTRSRIDRSAKKSGLFSYHYIKRGQVFEFSVRSDNTAYLEKIIGILNGKTKYFGKSKTAEFGGAVKIEYKDEQVNNENQNDKGKYLYAESNLCFLNDYGEFTATPTAEQLTGNSEAEIDWEKSQIRFRTFAPYNFFRRNWDFERLIIEKGSVFVFKNDVEFIKDKLNKGIGCFLTEGYGRVLINPSFLIEKELVLDTPTPSNNHVTSIIDKVDIDDNDLPVIKIIKNRFNRQMWEIEVDNLAKKTISDNPFLRKITKSQWARLFDATTRAKTDEELLEIIASEEEINGRVQSIFYGGINKWDKSDIKIIMDYLDDCLIEKDKNFGLRKLAKKVISKIEKQ